MIDKIFLDKLYSESHMALARHAALVKEKDFPDDGFSSKVQRAKIDMEAECCKLLDRLIKEYIK